MLVASDGSGNVERLDAMIHDKRGSKSSQSSGISASDASISNRLDALEKLVKEALNERNLWNSEVRGWIGQFVVVKLIMGDQSIGLLRWMDRYTICIEDQSLPSPQSTLVIHKAAIATIRLQ